MLSTSLRAAIGTLLAAAVLGLAATGAQAESRAYDLQPFTAATIDSQIRAKIVVGDTQSITAEARDVADLQDLRIEVVNGRLHAWVDRDFWDFVTFRDRDIDLTISVLSLNALAANSGSIVNATGLAGDVVIEASSGAQMILADVQANAARISASSAASIDVGGVCVTSKVEISSSAQIAGASFECADLTIDASSAGTATLFASGNVNASASSGALVNLAGHPRRVEDSVSSGADVDVLY
jgi:hypothetical protein